MIILTDRSITQVPDRAVEMRGLADHHADIPLGPWLEVRLAVRGEAPNIADMFVKSYNSQLAVTVTIQTFY